MGLKRKEAVMPTRTCLFCGNSFVPTHGNMDYCPGTDHSYLAKQERQTSTHMIGNDAKKAIQKNYKIFKTLLGDNKSMEVDLLAALKLGFNDNGYYGSGRITDTQKLCYKVHDFFFHILPSSPQKIKIWRTSAN